MPNPSQKLEDLRTLCFDEEEHYGTNYPPTKSFYTHIVLYLCDHHPRNHPVKLYGAATHTHKNNQTGCASPGRVVRSNIVIECMYATSVMKRWSPNEQKGTKLLYYYMKNLSTRKNGLPWYWQ